MGDSSRISLPVVGNANSHGGHHRRFPRWRAVTLAAVHLAIVAHYLHWVVAGRTLTPVEPSESMVTLETGAVNAGFVFFATTLLITLVFGRFLCGWGCHFIAYQDLCTWLLKRVGIKPRPLDSRSLRLIPIALAFYMFAWPAVYRGWRTFVADSPLPVEWAWSAHFMTTDFWATFPGVVFAILSVAIAGFSIVYFLGSKGFCTYACPYGALYGLADRMAPVRVRVSDACDGRGECTTVCTSNVNVAEEVKRYGAVVSSGCMKCGDCVASCPNGALRLGSGLPAVLTRARTNRDKPRVGIGLPLTEEAFLFGAFGFFLFAWRGLYGGFPLLMSAGLAGILAFATLLGVRLVLRSDVTLQNLRLKQAGAIQPAGWALAAAATGIVLFSAHSGVVQYQMALGNHHFDKTGAGDIVWTAGFDPRRDLPASVRAARDNARRHFESAQRWSLIQTSLLHTRLAWLLMLEGDNAAAERHACKAAELAPDVADLHRNHARILASLKQYDEALAALREALQLDPESVEARNALGSTLLLAGRFKDAHAHFRAETQSYPEDAIAHYHLGAVIIELGDAGSALKHLRRAIEIDPNLGEAHSQLGLALLSIEQPAEGEQHLRRAIALTPNLAAAHYNLAVARFMQADVDEAIACARRAAELNPEDAQTTAFLQMLVSQKQGKPIND